MNKKKQRPTRLGRPPKVEAKLRAYIAANPGCSRTETAEGIGHCYQYTLTLVSRLLKKRVLRENEGTLAMRKAAAV